VMDVRKLMRRLLAFLVLGVALSACTAEPAAVEVTRLVVSEIPVTVEVTRVVTQEISVEVPVEVTRVVEVPVTAVFTPTPENTAEAAAPTPQPTEPPAAPAVAGARYTVQPGDTLFSISVQTGVAMADIAAANSLGDSALIFSGQELVIPGWAGTTAVTPPAAVEQPAQPAPPPASAAANLLPNPSFEADWYFFNGVDEWQLPTQWMLAVDEGPNTLTPGSGGAFLRPEVRLLTTAHLPAGERELFVFDGQKTIKAFKGGAPTNFAIFTDITLPPGAYRLTIRFFPDTILAYDGSRKILNQQPLAAEFRIIYDSGGTAWAEAAVGVRNVHTYDFTLTATQTVRLGGAFRNRYVGSNNGWFIDDWSLQALSAP
jgi:LysM repeat protein